MINKTAVQVINVMLMFFIVVYTCILQSYNVSDDSTENNH